MRVKQWILTGVLLFLGLSLFAQLGITGRYQFPQTSNWKLLTEPGDFNETELIGNGFSLGVDYWFRLKNARVEFLPELNFSLFQQVTANESRLNAHWLSLYFNTNLYLFDLKGDCNCPTFSKQGTLFQKGFFVQVSPGLSLMNHSIRLPEDGDKLRTTMFAFSIGGGVGFDIGVSDLITVTPMGSVRYFPAATWDDLTRITLDAPEFQVPDEKSDIVLWQVGLRLGFRFDKE